MNAYLSLIGRGRGGRLFEAGRLLTFSAFRMGAYSRWALIRGWALIRINTVCVSSLWIAIFQRATQRARILFTDNIQNGGSCSVNFYYTVVVQCKIDFQKSPSSYFIWREQKRLAPLAKRSTCSESKCKITVLNSISDPTKWYIETHNTPRHDSRATLTGVRTRLLPWFAVFVHFLWTKIPIHSMASSEPWCPWTRMFHEQSLNLSKMELQHWTHAYPLYVKTDSFCWPLKPFSISEIRSWNIPTITEVTANPPQT